MGNRPSITFGGAQGLDLDRGETHVAFFDDQGKPAVFDVVDDFARNKTVVLESRKPVRVELKGPEKGYRWPLDMAMRGYARLTLPLYSQEGVAYVELAGVRQAVVPFVNLPWLAKKIALE